MICLYAETQLSTYFVIFYTCICVPFTQILQTFIRFCNFLLDPHHLPESRENADWEPDLPVSLFQTKNDCGDTVADYQETCSICLVEFEEDDSVDKLPKCGHLFHAECMEKWLDRCQFTCPLCRSSVLRLHSSPCKSKPPPFCIDHAL